MTEQRHHGGLQRDLARWMLRRRFLRGLGVATVVPLGACVVRDDATDDESSSGGGDTSTGGASTAADSTGAAGTCEPIPAETAGPYPGDGSNGPNALALSGIVRSDIRSSVDGATGTAEGIMTTVTLVLVDASNGCAPLADHAVYLWHCDRAGDYSMYTGAPAAENYLRGVQQTDADGKVTFTTIFPACYSGRWPHMHFEIYASLDDAMSGADPLHTSQLALPESDCNDVFATQGYEDSVGNLAQLSLDSDNIFSDGASLQMATVSGSVRVGYSASLVVGVPT
jgi:protocatechuate 3,4-dioxygenase beta subunit